MPNRTPSRTPLRATVPPFAIGSDVWPGAAKLLEEAGELVQVLGKLIAFPEDHPHPDGSHLRHRLVEELGDLSAAMRYFQAHNALPGGSDALARRSGEKFDRFQRWDGEERRRAR